MIGEPKFFNSSFSMTVRRGDIRTKAAFGGGSLYDIGVYCINAARYLFRAEPTEVMAVSVNSGVKALAEIDESTAAILRFDGERVASFVTSFNGAAVGEYRIVGTKGDIQVDPAYEYAEGLAYTMTVDGKAQRKAIGKRDQFAPQLLHFSDCVRRNRQPEPSGEEGLQDVRIVAGALPVGRDRQGGGDPAVPRRRGARPGGSASAGPASVNPRSSRCRARARTDSTAIPGDEPWRANSTSSTSWCSTSTPR